MLTSVWTPTNLRIDHTVSLLTNCLSKLSFSSFRLPFSAFDNWKNNNNINHAQTRFNRKSQNNFNQKYNVIIDTTIVWPMNTNNSLLVKSLVWFSLWCLILMPLSTIFQLYRSGQFIGEGNRSTWRKPPTCPMSLWVHQSSWWAPVLRPKISKTLFGTVNFSIII